MNYFKIAVILLAFVLNSCGHSNKKSYSKNINYQYLALGDSYTIGESVCDNCSYPEQLTDSLNQVFNEKMSVKIIAKTGWTTTDLIAAIEIDNPSKNYDLVTLLIGVNNQFQGKPFSVYEDEFPKLLNLAIDFAKGKPANVIVLSIPDYAYTSYGVNSGKTGQITSELDKYNAYAEKISKKKGVLFKDITAITREGLENPKLVASDGLHPSEVAYKRFVEIIFKTAAAIIR